MVEKRAETPDTEIAYAVLKAGYRPFDCSRQAMRREALATLAGTRRPANDSRAGAKPAEIIQLDLERQRRDQAPADTIR